MSYAEKIESLVAERDLLQQDVANARALAAKYLLLVQDVRLMATNGAMPNGMIVSGQTLKWAEEWALRLTSAEFKGSDDPKCLDAGLACIDCLCRRECLMCRPHAKAHLGKR